MFSEFIEDLLTRLYSYSTWSIEDRTAVWFHQLRFKCLTCVELCNFPWSSTDSPTEDGGPNHREEYEGWSLAR